MVLDRLCSLQNQVAITLEPFFLRSQCLSSVYPGFQGQFFKLICLLALELNRRLSAYDPKQQYTQYQGQLTVLMADFAQVIAQDDLLGIDDLVLRIMNIW